jgi:hypothetical protein
VIEFIGEFVMKHGEEEGWNWSYGGLNWARGREDEEVVVMKWWFG